MRHAFPLIFVVAAVVAVVVSCSPASTRSGSSNAGGAASGSSSNAGGNSGTGGLSLAGSGGSGGATCAGATTCAKAGVSCGPIGDGCGGILQCGTCAAGKTCGGGGTSGVCGTVTCMAKTCAQLGVNCGPVGDGCGQQLDCGTCSGGQTCGGGGMASVCGTGACTPNTCAGQGVDCGPVANGCGGILPCGACATGQTCGGGGIASVCGAPACTPNTCAQLGACGPVGDGCGGLLQCGGCSAPKTCGGAGTASVCGVPPSCTGLCLQQVSCPTPGVTTTVTGTVYSPNATDPLPDALVYVPNAAVQPFTPGVSCDNCGAAASGSPLVSTVTAVDGTFTLTNVPVGASIPLVIQLGRWRRQVTLPSVTACVPNAAAPSLTRMPRNQGEGDIPLMAFSTGAVDALECVMLKIGIDQSEFTAPGGGGRINLYEGLDDLTVPDGAAGGATLQGSPTEDQLWSTQAALNQYDMVLFPCQSNQTARTAAVQQNLIDYANAGGRIFATHFSYVWLYNDAPFMGTASWQVEQHPSPADQTGYIDMSFPKGLELAQWLQIVQASATLGQIQLQVLRHDNNGPIAPSQSWMTINDPVFPGANVHYTFNTPIGVPANQQCGRVLFDDFHVENVGDSDGMIFPTECAGGPMTPQEKLLEFMIFDLSSCVTPDVPPPCVPKTCAELGVQCGPTGDGCGVNVLQCGSCPTDQTCGGGGTPSVCGATQCTPRTCAEQGLHCGLAGDGCGNQIACGACATGQTCGGGGMPGVCGTQTCTPRTCAEQGIDCGPAGDGCGGLLQCGACPSGATCGAGNKPGVCGSPTCTPQSCASLGANCGPVGDGCGNILQCGTCSAPQTCGGGGSPSVCGGSGPQTQ
jgi:hypothetical protein